MSAGKTLFSYLSRCKCYMFRQEKNGRFIMLITICFQNSTVTIEKCGTTMLERFSSLLPFGSNSTQMGSFNCKRTVLDCVFNFKLKTFYILDIIEWRGMSYKDFDVRISIYYYVPNSTIVIVFIVIDNLYFNFRLIFDFSSFRVDFTNFRVSTKYHRTTNI